MYHTLLSIFFACLGVALAVPTVQSRDVSTTELKQFDFWVQYAAASYCYDNYAGKTGSKLACWAHNCPAVEAAGADIVFDFSNTTATDTAGFITVDNTNKAIVLAFRGSYSVRNWVADASFLYTDPKLCTGCQAESGFWSSWTLVREQILPILHTQTAQHPDYELVVVGHSLGAAVATLAAADIRTKGFNSTTLYAYASPRVANDKLADFITAQSNNYRFTHIDDPVPKLPLIAMGYAHVSPEYHITSANNVTVTPSDIQVNKGKYTGASLPDLLHFDAHHWYFEEADGCKGPGLPFR